MNFLIAENFVFSKLKLILTKGWGEAISNFFFTLLFYIKNLKQSSLNYII